MMEFIQILVLNERPIVLPVITTCAFLKAYLTLTAPPRLSAQPAAENQSAAFFMPPDSSQIPPSTRSKNPSLFTNEVKIG